MTLPPWWSAGLYEWALAVTLRLLTQNCHIYSSDVMTRSHQKMEPSCNKRVKSNLNLVISLFSCLEGTNRVNTFNRSLMISWQRNAQHRGQDVMWCSLTGPALSPRLQTKIRFSTIIKGTVSTVSFDLVLLPAVNRKPVVDSGWCWCWCPHSQGTLTLTHGPHTSSYNMILNPHNSYMFIQLSWKLKHVRC